MRLLATLLLVLPALTSTPSQAGVHWLCGLSEDATQLVCVADPDSGQPVSRPEPSVTAVVRGARFPLDPSRQYTVNFWSPATDLAFVDQLARATICYRSPGCQVTFSGPLQVPTPLRTAQRPG